MPDCHGRRALALSASGEDLPGAQQPQVFTLHGPAAILQPPVGRVGASLQQTTRTGNLAAADALLEENSPEGSADDNTKGMLTGTPSLADDFN